MPRRNRKVVTSVGPEEGLERRSADNAGQSGDDQGLSQIEDAEEESVEELADTGQSIEASVVEGVEDAADHPEQPVRSHENPSRRSP